MPDQIAVQFGGREVVLRRRGTRPDDSQCGIWRMTERGYQLEVSHAVNDNRVFAVYKRIHPTIAVSGEGDTPQAAASDVESKLRDARDELNLVLGENESKGNQ